MRKNYTYYASLPTDRNDFIKFLESKKEVIVVNNKLLQEINKEINEQNRNKKASKFYTGAAPIMLALSWWNPIGWVLSGVVLLSGVIGVSANDLKKYKLYSGKDLQGENIAILHKKSIDLKYDKIIYPEWVASVDYEHVNKNIKTK